MSILLSAALSVALMFQQAAPAADPQDGSTEVEGLVVTAKPIPEKEAIKAFVAGVSAQSANKKLARWDRKICPGVIGVRESYAQVLNDRIAKAALEVGLQVGEPGCKANMLIVGTAASDKLVRNMIAGNPDAFSKYDSGVTRGRKALNAFTNSKDPVRWWHVTARKTADGERYDVGGSVLVRGVGRLKSTTRDDFDHVIIVLDVSRIGKLKLGALADYIAMVGLAQIDPEADTHGVSSILNLFEDREVGATPADGLTEWDLAYLDGLYGARRDTLNSDGQVRDMVGSMAKDLSDSAAKPAAEPEDAPKKD